MKSIKKHLEDGTFNVTRHGSKAVAKSLETAPEPPADLPPMARKIWAAEVAELFEVTAIAGKDLGALRELVVQIMYMKIAEADLAKNGLVIIADLKAGKKAVTNPAWRVYQDAQKIVLQIRKEFGGTPLSGQRMAMPEAPKPDPLDFLDN